jgi:hypothetical protein
VEFRDKKLSVEQTIESEIGRRSDAVPEVLFFRNRLVARRDVGAIRLLRFSWRVRADVKTVDARRGRAPDP